MIHKAEYLLPGSFMPESIRLELPERTLAAAKAAAPPSAYCFTMFDEADPVDLGPEFSVTPKRLNVSGKVYLGGALYELAEVRSMGETILAENMEHNDWPRVIRCRTGNWQPFFDGDMVI